uniref:Uncharacterized protein n=1 Tax=Parascaris equorum TaxID=6256 RepID=A0A914RQQ2_PAREQ
MMANSVMPEDHGSLFALIAITEACCNLIAAIVFHMLFPVSIPILPQISFVILASILLIPLWLIWLVVKFCLRDGCYFKCLFVFVIILLISESIFKISFIIFGFFAFILLIYRFFNRWFQVALG